MQTVDPIDTGMHERIYFSLATQFGNLGDCIINDLVLRHLAEQATVFVLATNSPKWVVDMLRVYKHVHICHSYNEFVLKVLETAGPTSRRILFFKPGHFAASSNVFKLVRLMLAYIMCWVLVRSGWRIARIGASIDAYSASEALLQARLANLYAYYGVRDGRSYQILAKMGVASVAYTPDLAFLLPSAPVKPTLPRSCVAIVLRKRKWMNDTFPATISEQFHRLIPSGLCCCVVQQVETDNELAAGISQALGCKLTVFKQTKASADTVFEAYRGSAIAVSNRLHGLLFAWSQGAIPMAIVDESEDKKIIDLFTAIGISELLFPHRAVTDLESHIMQIYLARNYYNHKLSEIFEKQRSQLLGILKSRPWESRLPR